MTRKQYENTDNLSNNVPKIPAASTSTDSLESYRAFKINKTDEELDKQSRYSENTHILVCNDKSDFYQLQDDWNKLLQKSKEPHIFHSWEWLYTWWEIFANNEDELIILSVYDNYELIGLAPFYLQKTLFSKSLKSLGEGEPLHESVTTHYQDIICSEESRNLVINSVTKYLNENKNKWEYCKFSFVLDDSCLSAIIDKLNPPLLIKRSLGYRYCVNLKDSFENIYNRLGKSAKKSFRSKRNRLKKMGDISLESLDLKDSLEDSLNTHIDFHTHRQQALGHAGAFLEPRFKQFHHCLISRLENTNSIHDAQIRVLNISDEPIACTLNYISKNTEDPMVYAYSAGFKSTDDARLSPMFVFDMLEFEQLIDNSISYYDFLSAFDGSTYKSTYRADQFAVSRIYWFEKSPVALIFYCLLRSRFALSRIKKIIKQHILKRAT